MKAATVAFEFEVKETETSKTTATKSRNIRKAGGAWSFKNNVWPVTTLLGTRTVTATSISGTTASVLPTPPDLGEISVGRSLGMHERSRSGSETLGEWDEKDEADNEEDIHGISIVSRDRIV